MKRVVQYIQKFSVSHWGGAEEAIVQLAKPLRDHGFDSEVWATSVFSEVAEEHVGDISVRRFPGRYLSSREAAQAGSGKAAISPRLLIEIGTDSSIDLLHVHGHNRMASLVVAAARMRRIPVVITLHSQFMRLHPRWRYWFQNEYGIRHASSVIAVNQSILDSLTSAHVAGRRTAVIPNGVDMRAFASGDGRRFRRAIGIQDEPLVLTVGRICEAKNQKAILEVLPVLGQTVPDAHWGSDWIPVRPSSTLTTW